MSDGQWAGVLISVIVLGSGIFWKLWDGREKSTDASAKAHGEALVAQAEAHKRDRHELRVELHRERERLDDMIQRVTTMETHQRGFERLENTIRHAVEQLSSLQTSVAVIQERVMNGTPAQGTRLPSFSKGKGG